MKSSRILALALGLILWTGGALGAVNLPVWPAGHIFTVNQSYSGSYDNSETGSAGNATINANGCTWTVGTPGPQSLCGGPVDIYPVTIGTDCPVTATGHATLTDPLTLDVDFRMTQIQLSGNAYVATADLNLTGLDLLVDAHLEIYLLNNWTDVGTVHGDLHMETCPEMKDFEWPLEVGDLWNTTSTMHITGTYDVDLEILGYPLQESGPLDQTTDMNYDVSVAGMVSSMGCNAYEIISTETSGLGTMTSRYCDTWGWYSEKEITEVNMEGITLDQILWEITGNTLPDPPTPTPSAFGVVLDLPTHVNEGETFYVNATLSNSGAPRTDVPFVTVLEAFGSYYFYPTWTTVFDYESRTVASGDEVVAVLPSFTWPPAGSASSGLAFHSAFLNPAMDNIDGTMDSVYWTFGP